MISLVLLTAFQSAPALPTGVPVSADAKIIGKVRPNVYAAIWEYRTLPLVADLPVAKRQTFTGSIITLDVPQRGNVHVLNYKNGMRVVLDNPKSKIKENGVPLVSMLKRLPASADVRYANANGASFEVKLPGEEKKLDGFNGTLTAFFTKAGLKGMTIMMVNGKVKSSVWLKPSGLHK